MKTVGILGGGQLGWMLAESIIKYGGRPVVLSNGRALASERVVGTWNKPWDDPDVIDALFDECDVVTIEVEHVPLAALEPHADQMVPHPDIIRLAQNRIVEKTFLKKHDLPHAQFSKAESLAEALALRDELSFPVIVKTAIGGYDGRGQFRAKSAAEFEAALVELGDAIDRFGIVVEEPLEIVAEASVIIARSGDQNTVLPVFDNTHENHILDTTHLPSALPAGIQTRLLEYAAQAADLLDLDGLLTTEFFITTRPGRAGAPSVDGKHYVFFNEFAPRPHNSGHVSRNACTMSQYDVLARVLLDLPLSPVETIGDTWAMGNLLSDIWPDNDAPNFADALSSCDEVVDLVLYGKSPSRPARKMGHFVCHSADRSAATAAIERFRESL